MGRVLTLDDVEVSGRTVLLRVDLNSPLDPRTKAFLDDTRIRAILPTLNRLSQAKVVILAHQSRPGKADFTSTLGHARELGRLLGRRVDWVDDVCGEHAMAAIESLQPGQVLETSVKGGHTITGQTQLVERLSSVVDLYVNDAFACAHRASPSITGFAHHLPCLTGVLMQQEIEALNKALQEPARPCLAVLGGIKVDDSIVVADNMLRAGTADEVWFTGGVANLMIELAGIDIGAQNHDFLVRELGPAWHPTIEMAKALLLDFGDKLHLPVDLAANVEGNRVDLTLEDLPIAAPLFDMGLTSIRRLSAAIKSAGTVILNGPAGVFEMDDFALGTVEMLNACAESDAFTVMGGGHTATLVVKRGLASRMGHVSTGGGACLDFMAGRPLPAVVALEASAAHFQTPSLGTPDQR
ncbi:MAG: phosphoglycerate kinase [Candidatus Poseidoniaceae archaeon]